MTRGGSAAVLSMALLVWGTLLAATKSVDLDGRPGAESAVDLNVLQTFPPRIENKVTNRTPGDAFQFSWKSAGPGGFTSSVPVGNTNGVGVTWVWTTNQTVYAFTGNACANDVCFVQTAGPDPLGSVCELGCFDDGVRLTLAKGTSPGQVLLTWSGGVAPYGVYRAGSAVTIGSPTNLLLSTSGVQHTDTPPGSVVFYRVDAATCLERKPCQSNADCILVTEGACASRGPFAVPGRSMFASDVTVSSAALTSSLITFFSPPHEVFRAGSRVVPSASGVVLQDVLTNMSAAPVTVRVDPYPPGCCTEPGRISCGGDCFDWRTDAAHCGGCDIFCGEEEVCSEGRCISICPEGTVFCGEGCVNTQSDEENCGGCGESCGELEVCVEGGCTLYCPEGTTPCGDGCVSTQSDEENCGGCGESCGEAQICAEGVCSSCPDGLLVCGGTCVDPQFDEQNCGACGNACSASCDGYAYCYYGECFCGGEGFLGEGGGEGPPEAPRCQVPPSETTIPPGESSTQCTPVPGFLVKEIATSIRVCGDGIPAGDARCPDGSPATQGTFMKLVPDPSKPVGDAFLTPFAVHVEEPSHDGLIQPGETVGLLIEVLNAGPVPIRDLHAELKSLPVDLTDDGIANPVGVTISSALAAYGDVAGTPSGTTSCAELPPPHPATNDRSFRVTLGDGHPGDVSRPFVLSASGWVNGAPFTMDMPLALGIADICDPTARDGDFDGLVGLLPPLAALVPEGEPLIYPDKVFNPGQTIPARFRILCHGVSLRSGEIEEPEIVELAPVGGNALHLASLALNADPSHPYSLTFDFDATFQQWNFDLRTDALEPGAYVVKIRIGGRKTYEAAFVLR